MRQFCGIYVLYVNNSVKKTNKFQFGYWRPGVRISTLRPKKEKRVLVTLFSFFVGVFNSTPFALCAKEFAFQTKPSESLFSSGKCRNIAIRQYLHTRPTKSTSNTSSVILKQVFVCHLLPLEKAYCIHFTIWLGRAWLCSCTTRSFLHKKAPFFMKSAFCFIFS